MYQQPASQPAYKVWVTRSKWSDKNSLLYTLIHKTGSRGKRKSFDSSELTKIHLIQASLLTVLCYHIVGNLWSRAFSLLILVASRCLKYTGLPPRTGEPRSIYVSMAGSRVYTCWWHFLLIRCIEVASLDPSLCVVQALGRDELECPLFHCYTAVPTCTVHTCMYTSLYTHWVSYGDELSTLL